MILDPRFWLACVVALGLAYGGGYLTRMAHSVSLTEHDKTVAELSKLKTDVDTANRAAEADRARREALNHSATLAAEVALNAATVRANNRQAEVDRLLADPRLHVPVPDSVRGGYNASIRLSPEAGTDPGQVPGSPGTTADAPLMLDVFAKVCTANAIDQNRLADRYTALLTYTQSLWTACNRKESP